MAPRTISNIAYTVTVYDDGRMEMLRYVAVPSQWRLLQNWPATLPLGVQVTEAFIAPRDDGRGGFRISAQLASPDQAAQMIDWLLDAIQSGWDDSDADL